MNGYISKKALLFAMITEICSFGWEVYIVTKRPNKILERNGKNSNTFSFCFYLLVPAAVNFINTQAAVSPKELAN